MFPEKHTHPAYGNSCYDQSLSSANASSVPDVQACIFGQCFHLKVTDGELEAQREEEVA